MFASLIINWFRSCELFPFYTNFVNYIIYWKKIIKLTVIWDSLLHREHDREEYVPSIYRCTQIRKRSSEQEGKTNNRLYIKASKMSMGGKGTRQKKMKGRKPWSVKLRNNLSKLVTLKDLITQKLRRLTK